MSGAQKGAPIEAVLIGVDTSSSKVWLSMRQVQPDPLQETLNALLAQGPPAGGAGGSERAELTPATDLDSDPADFNEDESMVQTCLITLSDVQPLEFVCGSSCADGVCQEASTDIARLSCRQAVAL